LTGYVMIPGWLLALKPSANAVLIYATLATYGTFNTAAGVYEECRPSIATIAADSCTSDSTVKRALDELRQLRAIERTERWAEDGRTRLPSVYRVIFGAIAGPTPFTGEPTPPTTGERGVGSPVTQNPEPSTQNQNTQKEGFGDETSPTAQTILKDFIDWLARPEQGQVQLSKRVIGIYAKSIKQLLGENFPEKLIKNALAVMTERGLTSRPSLLESFVVEVQGSRPVSVPPAPRTFKQMDADDKERQRLIVLAMEKVMEADPTVTAAKAREIVNGLVEHGELDLYRLSTSAATGYIDGNVITVEAEEVTGS
jgi:hypothetical protein